MAATAAMLVVWSPRRCGPETVRSLRGGESGEAGAGPEAGDIEAGGVGVRSFEAIAGERAIDELRVALRQDVVAKARPLNAAGADVGEEHVGRVRQLADDFASLFRPGVHHDGFLAAVVAVEGGVVGELFLVRPLGREIGADGIAAGRLDLYDFRAKSERMPPAPGAAKYVACSMTFTPLSSMRLSPDFLVLVAHFPAHREHLLTRGSNCHFSNEFKPPEARRPVQMTIATMRSALTQDDIRRLVRGDTAEARANSARRDLPSHRHDGPQPGGSGKRAANPRRDVLGCRRAGAPRPCRHPEELRPSCRATLPIKLAKDHRHHRRAGSEELAGDRG